MRDRPSPLVAYGLLASLAGLAFLRPATAGELRLPAALEVEPNAIQDPRGGMHVEVHGIPNGARVWLEVLQDCDGDREGDRVSEAGCRSPLYQRWSVAAERGNVVRDRFDFAAIAEQLAAEGAPPLPRDIVLWLRAARTAEAPGLTVRFGLVADPCSLWRSVIDVFLRGRCNPGLARAFYQRRGTGTSLAAVRFEVALIAPGEGAEARVVAGTEGATGVAWQGTGALLVTVAAPDGLPAGARPSLPAGAGLYRVPLDGGAVRRLWAPAADSEIMPAAPLALPGGAVAFVRQRLEAARGPTGEPVAWLTVLRDGAVTAEIPLTYTAHQLLAASADGQAVLALTLGVGGRAPGLLNIDLGTRTAHYLGYYHGLYTAAMRAPNDDRVVIATADAGDDGFDLVLLDAAGRRLRDLVRRPDLHELLPAWRPDGAELAFLAEVDRPRGLSDRP